MLNQVNTAWSWSGSRTSDISTTHLRIAITWCASSYPIIHTASLPSASQLNQRATGEQILLTWPLIGALRSLHDPQCHSSLLNRQVRFEGTDHIVSHRRTALRMR